MTNNNFKDPFEKWQYLIFKIVLLILFLVTAFKILDSELHISRFWSNEPVNRSVVKDSED